MPSFSAAYPTLLAALAEHYGQPPASAVKPPAFEAVLAAGLGGDPAAPGKLRVLAALGRSGLLEPGTLAAIDGAELRDAVREAGLPIAPAQGLLIQRLARWFASAFPDEDDARDEAARPTSTIRDELAAINGVGLATADSILLALDRPAFPVDRATFRILSRHGWADRFTEYEEVRSLLTSPTRDDPGEIAAVSSWLQRVGRQFCGPRSPRCTGCPLKCLLPEGGAVEPDP